MSLLKLLAMDGDDLQIVSAHLQDAVVKVKDLDWRTAEKRFVAIFNRFAWENESRKSAFIRCKTPPERRLSALRFDRVLSIRTMGVDRNRPEDVLSLLALRFDEHDAPGGTVELIFSGNIGLRLEVECVEVQLSDLGPAWQARSRPHHT